MPRKGRPYFIKKLELIPNKQKGRNTKWNAIPSLCAFFNQGSKALVSSFRTALVLLEASHFKIRDYKLAWKKASCLRQLFPYLFVLSTFFFFLLNVWWRKLERTLIELLLLSADFSPFLPKKRNYTVYIVNINMLFFCCNKSLRSTRSFCHPKTFFFTLFRGFRTQGRLNIE